MTPYYEHAGITIYHGDCREILPTLGQVATCVLTDPPYGLEFMGKEWDKLAGGDSWRVGGGFLKPGIGERKTEWASFGRGDTANATCSKCGGRMRGKKRCACPEPDWKVKGRGLDPRAAARIRSQGMQAWFTEHFAAILDACLPGAPLMAFGGTRTHHRLMCGIEDAGWEIRDALMWLTGSGFPKSLNFGCRCSTNTLPSSNEKSGKSQCDLHGLRGGDEVAPETTGGSEGADVLSGVQRDEPGPGLGEARPQGSRGGDARGAGVGRSEDDRIEESGMEGGPLHDAGRIHDGSATGSPEGSPERLRSGARLDSGGGAGPSPETGRGSTPRESRQSRQSTGESDGVQEPSGALGEAPSGRCPECGGLEAFSGYGTALKPAWESITLAMRPLDGTFAQNAERHGVAGLNVDGGRIGTEAGYDPQGATPGDESAPISRGNPRPWHDDPEARDATAERAAQGREKSKALGRWPSNLLLSHVGGPDGCREVGTKRVRGSAPQGREMDWSDDASGYGGGLKAVGKIHAGYADADGLETVAAWECVESCPVRMLDEQAGERPSSDGIRPRGTGNLVYGKHRDTPFESYGDTGGPSRFYYTSKVSSAERGDSTHPTMKPLALIRYLLKLLAPPDGGLVLDPFMGSGTTLAAAKCMHLKAIGIELDEASCEIAAKRLSQDVLPL